MSVGLLLFTRLPALAIHALRNLRKKTLRRRRDVSSIHNILVLRLDNLGDVVMSTAMFRKIKQHYPDAQLTVMAQDRCCSILETNPFIDNILRIKQLPRVRFLVSFFALLSTVVFYLRYLRTTDFDIVLHPRLGGDGMNESLLIALIDAPLSIGYRESASTWLQRSGRDHTLRHALPQPEPQNEVFSNAAIVSSLTQFDFFPKTEIFLTAADLEFAAQRLATFPKNHLVVALGFGAMLGRRRWPSPKWAEAFDMLGRQHQISVLILAAPADREEAIHIHSALRINSELLIGSSIREVAACISKSDIFVGVDSGLAHIAAAVNVPTVVISPHPKNGDPKHYNSPVRFAPFGEKVIVVTPSLAEPPCSLSCDMQEAHCILQIPPQEVVEACIRLLKN